MTHALYRIGAIACSPTTVTMSVASSAVRTLTRSTAVARNGIINTTCSPASVVVASAPKKAARSAYGFSGLSAAVTAATSAVPSPDSRTPVIGFNVPIDLASNGAKKITSFWLPVGATHAPRKRLGLVLLPQTAEPQCAATEATEIFV